jgi:hypothetical protein
MSEARRRAVATPYFGNSTSLFSTDSMLVRGDNLETLPIWVREESVDFVYPLTVAGSCPATSARQVLPGDTLELEVSIGRLSARAGTGRGVASVGGHVACEADLLFVLAPRSPARST